MSSPLSVIFTVHAVFACVQVTVVNAVVMIYNTYLTYILFLQFWSELFLNAQCIKAGFIRQCFIEVLIQLISLGEKNKQTL